MGLHAIRPVEEQGREANGLNQGMGGPAALGKFVHSCGLRLFANRQTVDGVFSRPFCIVDCKRKPYEEILKSDTFFSTATPIKSMSNPQWSRNTINASPFRTLPALHA
ncbi:hypothetical protein J6590_005130 [Homalodisca vitripennis]|nr:hypothetical protein J6590_005130 [Homalodisca vitripennis]